MEEIEEMTTNEKIAKVREKMAENKIDAVIVPSADPHMSEYFSDHWKTRAWLSGFTGSAGTFVITKSVGRWALLCAGRKTACRQRRCPF